MLAWLDAVAGISWLAVAVAGWRSSRRFAVIAALATVGWFAGNLDSHLLLIHRPLMLHAALAYPDGRVPGRYPPAGCIHHVRGLVRRPGRHGLVHHDHDV
jgi:hypothetical protein